MADVEDRFRCEICGRGPMSDGSTVFRVSEKGKTPARWRCKWHRGESVDDDLVELCGVIEGKA